MSTRRKQSPPRRETLAPAKRPVRRAHALVIALLAGLLYANTIPNGYVLDDLPVIRQNPAIQRGLAGIPELLRSDLWHSSSFNLGYYRPLSLITFAVEQQFFEGNPHISHLINALLFSLAGALVFLLLCRVFSTRSTFFSLLISLLFVCHPIHTEIVASIKGRDELLSFSSLAASLWLFLRYCDGRKPAYLILSSLCFYLALLSKETALIGVALAPLVLHFSEGGSPVAAARKAWPLAVVALLFLLQKELALPAANVFVPDDLNNYPYRDAASRLPTALYLFLFGLRLLVVPHPLRYDYSFDQIPAVHWDSAWPYFGAFVYCGGILWGLKAYRRGSAAGFGLAFLYVTMLPAMAFTLLRGGIFAERLLFSPSLGYCILLVAALSALCKSESRQSEEASSAWGLRERVPAVTVLVLCTLFGFETVTRNRVWKDNLTLFAHDIRTGAASAQNQRHLGEELVNLAMREKEPTKKAQLVGEATAALKEAIRINPNFGQAYFALGLISHVVAPDRELAISYYWKSIATAPGHARSYFELGRVYQSQGENNKASYLYNQALQRDPGYAEARAAADALKAATGLDIQVDPFASAASVPTVAKDADDYFKLGDYFASQGDYLQAAANYEKAYGMNADNVSAGINLANCYGMLKRYPETIELLTKLQVRFPNDPVVLENLAAAHGLMGQKQTSDEYFERARRLRQGK